jgi:hypothetical protein
MIFLVLLLSFLIVLNAEKRQSSSYAKQRRSEDVNPKQFFSTTPNGAHFRASDFASQFASSNHGPQFDDNLDPKLDSFLNFATIASLVSSPSVSSVAFVASQQGVSNIFYCDLYTHAINQLTSYDEVRRRLGWNGVYLRDYLRRGILFLFLKIITFFFKKFHSLLLILTPRTTVWPWTLSVSRLMASSSTRRRLLTAPTPGIWHVQAISPACSWE